MEESYDGLRRDPAEAVRAFGLDYAPLAPLLGPLRGRVLDVGGGLGVTRHWLSDDVRYTLVEPSAAWLDPGWGALSSAFPCLRARPTQARAVGESLPFRDAAFDAVLALWVLNHARDPAAAVAEAARVLRPGGVFIAVLEDMEPTWSDLRARRYPAGAPHARGAWLRKAARAWPLQDDHVRIRERDLRRWLADRFRDLRRDWIGVYLGFEAVRS